MSAAFYRSGEWRRLRAAVLARDPVCASRGCGRPAVHVDHVVPRSRGGADTLGNLRGACQSCHNRRSAAGNAPLRAIGCLPDGSPRDPADPWVHHISQHCRFLIFYPHLPDLEMFRQKFADNLHVLRVIHMMVGV